MPIPPQVIAAGIGAVSSLLGGRAASKEARRARQQQQADIAAQNLYNSPKQIRARAEEGGFNPLLFAGPGVGLQSAIPDLMQPVMGQAIANAGMQMASGLMEAAEAQAQADAVAQQNAELRKTVEKLTLRPAVPGIYSAQPSGGLQSAGFTTVPDAPAVEPVTLAFGAKQGAIPLPFGEALPDELGTDPRRMVEHKPQETNSGFMVVDNPYVGRIYVPTLDGDEVIDVLDIPSAFVAGGQVLGNLTAKGAEAGGKASAPSYKISRSEAEALQRKHMPWAFDRWIGPGKPSGGFPRYPSSQYNPFVR